MANDDVYVQDKAAYTPMHFHLMRLFWVFQHAGNETAYRLPFWWIFINAFIWHFIETKWNLIFIWQFIEWNFRLFRVLQLHCIGIFLVVYLQILLTDCILRWWPSSIFSCQFSASIWTIGHCYHHWIKSNWFKLHFTRNFCGKCISDANIRSESDWIHCYLLRWLGWSIYGIDVHFFDSIPTFNINCIEMRNKILFFERRREILRSEPAIRQFNSFWWITSQSNFISTQWRTQSKPNENRFLCAAFPFCC